MGQKSSNFVKDEIKKQQLKHTITMDVEIIDKRKRIFSKIMVFDKPTYDDIISTVYNDTWINESFETTDLMKKTKM